MVKFLINRPVAVFMATFALLLLGIVASLRIPTSLMPDIDIPQITVNLSYPNSNAREIETNITRPLKNQLLQVGNLEEVESQTRDGFATIKLFFEHGTDTNLAFIETNEKIDASLNFLPRDLERPRVIKASATDIPILYLTVSLRRDYSDEHFLQLSEFTETVLKKRIEQLPDIALADMSGQSKAEVVIVPKRNKLQSLGISNKKLVQSIEQNNFELGNMLVQDGIYQYNFKFSNPLQNIGDIENIYINHHNRLFQLKELAAVSLQPQKERGSVFYNGKRAIALAIIKQSGTQVYDLKESLENLIQSFEKDYSNLQFSTNQDQSKLLKHSIDNLKSSLIVGGFLAILIMFFFLKDFKSPLIIAISIPVALLLSILAMYLFGLSINVISLSGLILGVGMMIDNSIIVIDNIIQKLERGLPLETACVVGTNEIIAPLLSSVLTTCSVFLPLVFLSGITGALFYDQAMAISIGLGTSFLISITLIPVIFKQLKNKNFKFEKWLSFGVGTPNIENSYEKGMVYFFKRKWIVYGISIINILLAILLFNSMRYTQLPEIDRNESILSLDWNENITVFENKQRIENTLKNIPVKTRFAQIGEQQFLLQQEETKAMSEATVYLKAETNQELQKAKKAIQQNLTRSFPNANYVFSPPKTIFEYLFGGEENKLVAKIYSTTSIEAPSENELRRIKPYFESEISEVPLKETTTIQILNEKVLLYNVDHQDLINELKTAFGENFIDNLETAEKFIPIKMDYAVSGLDNIIDRLFVKNENGELIPVKSLIKINQVQKYKTLTADRSGEYLGFAVKIANNIDDEMLNIQNNFKNSEAYNVHFSGSGLEFKESAKELVAVIFVALFLLFFILAAQFESLWQPLIIMLEIPINIGAGLLLLWIFGETINIMAMIGIVVMSGIVVNDSILKIHTINMLRKKGHGTKEAIMLGGKMRLKSILMTALTTVLALLPFLFIGGLGSELQRPLSLVIIGGLTLGTFISLYLIPLVYYTFAKKFNL